jgi:hypothetical protein
VELEEKERTHLAEVLGKSSTDLRNVFSMDPGRVYRHTATKPSYERFAPLRLASIFELLDMKHQLRMMDRVMLLGGTNFIVLVKKGSDKQPATAGEMAALQSNVRQVARTPIIVGDHRLDVEIISPKLDTTLDPARYNNLDSRITARLYQIMHLGGFSAGASGDDSIKLARIIAKGLEGRRASIRRKFEREILIPTWKANRTKLKNRPHLRISPRQVALDFDANFLSAIRDMYFAGPVSTETALDILGLDISTEAHLTMIEKTTYGDVFEPREMQAGQAGRVTGGNKGGGGENPDSRRPNDRPRRTDNDTPVEDKTTDDKD